MALVVPSTVRNCVRRCLLLPKCVAIERFVPNASCTLLSECLHRERAANHVVAHYQPPPWPSPAAQIHWRTGVAMVVASYRKNIREVATFLEAFTPAADLVVYHKHDFNGSLHVPGGWLQHVLDECLGEHGRLLSYLQVLPNHGSTKQTLPSAPSGGSREPYAFLQFLIDFYDNLPALVLFSQDDHHNRGMYALPVASDALTRVLAGGDAAVETYARVPRRPDNATCFCRYARSSQFNRSGYHWIVSGLRRELFHAQSTSAHDPLQPGFEHSYPQAARFAIGRADVLTRPQWLYQLLARLTTAEKVWHWIGSSYMAHVLERFWFVLFDPELHVRTRADETAGMNNTLCPNPGGAGGSNADSLDWTWEFQTACEVASPGGDFRAMFACTELANALVGGCPFFHPPSSTSPRVHSVNMA
jgi:hypothetical protein